MPELFLGLRSGTSVDGIDAALVDLSAAQPDVFYAQTYAWPEALRERLLAILQERTRVSMQELGELDAAGVQRTLVEFSALSVATALERFCRDVDGTENYGLHPDWVQATAFAWLAKQTLENRPGNLPAVTGARRPMVLGASYHA